MPKAKTEFPLTVIMSDWRVRYVAVAFGAPDDNQTIDGIQDPFDRERCKARLAYEREFRHLDLEASFKNFGSVTGRIEDIADPTGRAEAKQAVTKSFAYITSFTREALRYPALIRNNARLREILLNPWFDRTGPTP